MEYVLPTIPFVRLRFFLRAQTDCALPVWKGSLLRGAFGQALRQVACAMPRRQTCSPCLLRKQCVYTRLFEPYIDGEPPQFLRGLDTAPRGYIFDAAAETQEGYNANDPLTFDLVLFGNITNLYPYALYAVQRMAETGLGYGRHPFQLQHTDWLTDAGDAPQNWQLLFDSKTNLLKTEVKPLLPPEGPDMDTHVTLKFLTPTRLKIDNKLSINFNFRQLAFKMIRRVLEIAHFYAPDQTIDWEFNPLLQLAGKVEITNRSLIWQDQHRHSNRQQTDMEMGGFVGDLVLQGNLQPFTQLLYTSEILHVGKGTVFGLGKIKLMPG